MKLAFLSSVQKQQQGREVLESGYPVSQQQCLHRICSKTKSKVGGTIKTRQSVQDLL